MILSVTFFSFITNIDFNYCGFLCSGIISALTYTAVFAYFFKITTPVIISLASLIAYTFYIVIVTQLILGGNKYEIRVDDYVAGVVILYTEIVKWFLALISVLAW